MQTVPLPLTQNDMDVVVSSTYEAHCNVLVNGRTSIHTKHLETKHIDVAFEP